MSDKYDEVAERIHMNIAEWIAGPNDGRTFGGITAAILREAYPSAQGEDERALRAAISGWFDSPAGGKWMIPLNFIESVVAKILPLLRCRPAKPFLEENVDRWLDGEATGLVNALWAKIDESYADRNGNGETERVVRESHEIAKQWLIETFADLRAALRSRLAEPVITREEIECMPLVSTLPYPKPAMSEEDERLPTARDAKELVEHIMATWGEQQYDVINEIDRYVAMRIRAALASDRERYARQFADMSANEIKLSAVLASERAEAIAAHGYLANPDDVGRVAHLLEQSEPAQAAPNEEDALEDLDAMKRRLMDESDAMDEVTTHRWWWRYSQNVDSRLRAALTSERAKRDDYVDGLEEFAQSIVNWAQAYPEKIFHEPSPEQFQEVCKALKVTPDCFAAMVLRQFTKPWGEKARIALLRSEPRKE